MKQSEKRKSLFGEASHWSLHCIAETWECWSKLWYCVRYVHNVAEDCYVMSLIMMSFLCCPLQWLRFHPPEGHAAAGPVPGVPEESRIRPSVCESPFVFTYWLFSFCRADKSLSGSELILQVFMLALCCSFTSVGKKLRKEWQKCRLVVNWVTGWVSNSQDM